MSKLFGVSPGQIIPGPDFNPRRATDGRWTGSITCRIRQADRNNASVVQAFSKGAPVSAVYPQGGVFWNFLRVDTAEFQDVPGGWTEVRLAFIGYQESEFGLDREVEYSRNSTLVERPIIEHPKFLKDVDDENDRRYIVMAYNGLAKADERARPEIDVIIIATDMRQGRLTSSKAKAWWKKIVDEGKRTYEAPTSEWTKSSANAGGISAGQMSKLSFIDTPDGNPGTPSGYNWRMTGATERKTEDSVSYSITWTMSEKNGFDEKIYGEEDIDT